MTLPHLRLLAFTIFLSVFAFGCNRAPVATRADMQADNGSIWSVVKRKDVVFAATDKGLYRASLNDRIWYKLPTPSSMSHWGHFAREAAPSSPLVYYTGPGEMGVTKEPTTLYVSEDLGLSWKLTSTEYNLMEAFIHPDGTLYAVAYIKSASAPTKSNPEYSESSTGEDGQTFYPERRLLASHNLGKSWTDISEGLPTQYESMIVQDPDHPDLICIETRRPMHPFPLYVYQADDRNYHWKKTGKSPNELPINRMNLFGSLSPGSNNSNDVASLSTFFKLPYLKWGNNLMMQAGQIEAEKPTYTFHRHEPMPVNLTIKFVFPRPPLKFYDNKNETICWFLRGYSERGDHVLTKCRASDLYVDIPDHDSKMKQYADDPDRLIVDLEEAHSYTRTIDLSKLYGFPQPGKYQLQPVKAFCSFFKGDASFAGQVIDVIIID
jgi:hypothetical protein